MALLSRPFGRKRQRGFDIGMPSPYDREWRRSFAPRQTVLLPTSSPVVVRRLTDVGYCLAGATCRVGATPLHRCEGPQAFATPRRWRMPEDRHVRIDVSGY